MAIRGSLREASLPDVVQLLAMGKKTGCLSVTNRRQFGSIYFEDGRVTHAAIVNRRDRLGDILVKSGLVTQEDLEAAIAQQSRHPDMRLGEILLAMGKIRREELERYIRHQVEEAVYFLFTWTHGTFTFEPDARPEFHDVALSLSAESLLLEGARRVDEWNLIEKKVPSFDSVFSIDREHLARSGVELTPEQRAIVPLIDGRRDVNALVDASGLSEFEVGKALYGLATAGFLHRLGRSKGVDTPGGTVRLEEHRNLGVAFYRSGMLDEAAREFLRILELKPGDVSAEFFLGLGALRQGRLEEAVRRFRGVVERNPALVAPRLNLAYALERSGRLNEAGEVLDRAAQLTPDPHVRLAQAVLELGRGNLAAAAGRLQECAGYWEGRSRPAAWFHYAGLVAVLEGNLDRAAAILREGIELHPHRAPLYNNLAVVLQRAGQDSEALAAAERGSLEDPTVPQLHKNVGDVHYQAGRFEDALEAYLRAVRYDPGLGSDVYLRLGNIRFERGEVEEAVRCWQRALSLDPANEPARRNLELAQQHA
jgi:tetratricopeptide (TPR) repeat protein